MMIVDGRRRIRHFFVLLFSVRTFVLGLSLEDRRRPPSSVPVRQIPITVLSGFLGSGKTSLLQNLLNNNQGLRIAVIVNDVASVNIDSKLVSSSQQQQQEQQLSGSQAPAGIVQMENGCACCSLSEELLGSVSELVMLSDMRGEGLGFDHIVVELSGIADPRGVRAKFQEAVLYDMPLMERVRLDTMVTLVDCSVFLDHLKNSKLANPDDSPELFYRPGEQPVETQQADWADDMPAPLLEALLAGQRVYGSSDDVEGGVVDLLVSQCEIADVCLLNKVDLCEANDLLRIESIVKALNPRATLFPTKFGHVAIDKVLAVAGGKGVVEAGVVDDHKDAVKAASKTSLIETTTSRPQTNADSHDDHDPTNCNDPSCSDPSHSHEHHDHHHSHSHEHQHDHENSNHHCDDPDCTDPSHSHDHTHFGIGSFVYRARRPFHPGRLVSFLRRLPVSRGLPTEEIVDSDSSTTVAVTFQQETVDALQRVLRSKGFVWCAHSDVAALYWSHAGTSFELNCLGRWWATLARENWPPEAINTILEDFVSTKEIDEDTDLYFVGDRRQELVFIGPTLDGSSRQEAISSALNQCLLNDEEWKTYCKLRNDDRSLRTMFPNPIESKVVTY